MGEQKMPNRDPSSVGNQPDRQFPDVASTPQRDRDMDHSDAARRQARQDPLQTRDR